MTNCTDNRLLIQIIPIKTEIEKNIKEYISVNVSLDVETDWFVEMTVEVVRLFEIVILGHLNAADLSLAYYLGSASLGALSNCSKVTVHPWDHHPLVHTMAWRHEVLLLLGIEVQRRFDSPPWPGASRFTSSTAGRATLVLVLLVLLLFGASSS